MVKSQFSEINKWGSHFPVSSTPCNILRGIQKGPQKGSDLFANANLGPVVTRFQGTAERGLLMGPKGVLFASWLHNKGKLIAIYYKLLSKFTGQDQQKMTRKARPETGNRISQ